MILLWLFDLPTTLKPIAAFAAKPNGPVNILAAICWVCYIVDNVNTVYVLMWYCCWLVN